MWKLTYEASENYVFVIYFGRISFDCLYTRLPEMLIYRNIFQKLTEFTPPLFFFFFFGKLKFTPKLISWVFPIKETKFYLITVKNNDIIIIN